MSYGGHGKFYHFLVLLKSICPTDFKLENVTMTLGPLCFGPLNCEDGESIPSGIWGLTCARGLTIMQRRDRHLEANGATREKAEPTGCPWTWIRAPGRYDIDNRFLMIPVPPQGWWGGSTDCNCTGMVFIMDLKKSGWPIHLGQWCLDFEWIVKPLVSLALLLPHFILKACSQHALMQSFRCST